jgi:DNA-directed RNA polymerase specialized sigma24 family protein
MVYLNGYSVCEAAHRLGTSRQAANQMKNRALKKLKTQFADKP